MQGDRGDVTALLLPRGGDEDARAALIPLMYHELRRPAGHFLHRERPGHALQATALVHEAYVGLLRQNAAAWQDRAHFMAISAQIMRRILLQYALRRLAKMDPQRARIVEMRYFGGLSVEETAEALGISPRTINRHGAVAKIWLGAELMGANLK